MFLRFANFHQQFIQGFSQIVVLLISILKIIISGSSSNKLIVDGENSTIENVGHSCNNKVNIVVKANMRFFQSKMVKAKIVLHSKKLKTRFFTSKAKSVFAKFQQTFIKVFNLKYHI